MPRYTTDRARPGLVALYDIRPGNGAGQFLQPRSPHGAENTVLDHYNSCGDHADLTLRWRRRPQTAAQLLQLGLSLPPEILLLLSTEHSLIHKQKTQQQCKVTHHLFTFGDDTDSL